MKITYGADPEFFVHEIKTGEIIPACGRFGGSKKNPIPLTPDGGFLEDGVAIELNVRPQTTIRALQAKLQELVLAFQTKFPGYLLYPGLGAHYFGDRRLRNFPTAMVIGCDADYWFYGIRKNPQVNEMRGNRFTGGHLHVGLQDMPEGWDADMIIPILDILLLGPNLNNQNRLRWRFYGHPGLYRTPSYGLEYRSLDNWWIPIYGGPLQTKKTFDAYTASTTTWDSDLEIVLEKIEKIPEATKDNLFYLFKHNFEIERFLGSRKISLDPGFAKPLVDYKPPLMELIKRIK